MVLGTSCFTKLVRAMFGKFSERALPCPSRVLTTGQLPTNLEILVPVRINKCSATGCGGGNNRHHNNAVCLAPSSSGVSRPCVADPRCLSSGVLCLERFAWPNMMAVGPCLG